MFLDENVRSDAVLMKLIARETNISVPRVIDYKISADSPTG